MKFKHGDKVIVKRGFYKGMTGSIDDKYGFSYWITFDNHKFRLVSRFKIEKYIEPELIIEKDPLKTIISLPNSTKEALKQFKEAYQKGEYVFTNNEVHIIKV